MVFIRMGFIRLSGLLFQFRLSPLEPVSSVSLLELTSLLAFRIVYCM
jgi:hypothetical protein